MTHADIATAARHAWVQDEEGRAQRDARAVLDDDEPNADPLIGWMPGFVSAAEPIGLYTVDELWRGYRATGSDLDGSAVHKRFLRGYAAGKAWREGGR